MFEFIPQWASETWLAIGMVWAFTITLLRDRDLTATSRKAFMLGTIGFALSALSDIFGCVTLDIVSLLMLIVASYYFLKSASNSYVSVV
ncbi:hypothetical protein BG842_03970 [Haladaptatus sp. W1]|nr:hypothetical protein BG842_03970 [Haladaptatus sp. W1]